MDVIHISEQIQFKINQLDLSINKLKERSINKAESISEYDRVLAITIIKLKNNVVFELDGEKVEKPPVTIIEKLAKGICYKERLQLETADAEYKSLMSGIACIQAQLNAYQSIFRHMQ